MLQCRESILNLHVVSWRFVWHCFELLGLDEEIILSLFALFDPWLLLSVERQRHLNSLLLYYPWSLFSIVGHVHYI